MAQNNSTNIQKYGYMVPATTMTKILKVWRQIVCCPNGEEDWPEAEELLDELERTYGHK